MKHMNEGSTFKPGHSKGGHFKPTGAKHDTKFHPGKGTDGHKPGKYGGHEGHGMKSEGAGMHEKHMGEHHSGHMGDMGEHSDSHMSKAHGKEHHHMVHHHEDHTMHKSHNVISLPGHDMKEFPVADHEHHVHTAHHFGPELPGYEPK